MRNGRSLELIDGVPAGSGLAVAVGPANGKVYASGLWVTSGNVPDAYWPDRELVPGSKVQPLAGRKAYWLELSLDFLNAETAQVDAVVTDPAGGVFDHVQWTIPGTQGASKRIVLIVRTR